MNGAVLDASAVLAWTFREDGHETVAEQLRPGAMMSAVNWSEVLQKIAARGADPDQLGDRILALGLQITPFGPADAAATAKLYPHTRSSGLSLADRACLALAHLRQAPVFTADRAWKDLDLETDLHLIR